MTETSALSYTCQLCDWTHLGTPLQIETAANEHYRRTHHSVFTANGVSE